MTYISNSTIEELEKRKAELTSQIDFLYENESVVWDAQTIELEEMLNNKLNTVHKDLEKELAAAEVEESHQDLLYHYGK